MCLRPAGAGLAMGRSRPGAPGPSGFCRRDALPSRDSVCVWPRRRAESSWGGAARHFPARKLLSSRQRVSRRERDLEPPNSWGPGWRLEDTAGPEAPARNTHSHRARLRQLFLSWGQFLQWCFIAPATCLQRFGRNGERALLVYFLPALRCAHFFVLLKPDN